VQAAGYTTNYQKRYRDPKLCRGRLRFDRGQGRSASIAGRCGGTGRIHAWAGMDLDADAAASAVHQAAKLYAEIRQPQKAIEAYQRCIRLCLEPDPQLLDNRSNFKQLFARALYGKGRVEFETSDYQNAVESYTRSMKAFEQIDSKLDCIFILNDLGALYINTGDYKTAKEVSERSISLAASLFKGNESLSLSKYSKAIAWSNLSRSASNSAMIERVSKRAS